MIPYIILSLWALFIVAVLIGAQKARKCTNFDFQNFGVTDIPYITLNIQGNLMNMIVDTGCGISMLVVPALKEMELLYKKSSKRVALSAITNDKVNAGAITVDFNIGKKKVTEDFYLQDYEDFGNFQKMYGITVHGLLGTSFFDNNNCRIDYKNHRLIVP